jgi:hypothetical protein
MIAGDDKLPVKHTFTRKGDAAYDSALEVVSSLTGPMRLASTPW